MTATIGSGLNFEGLMGQSGNPGYRLDGDVSLKEARAVGLTPLHRYLEVWNRDFTQVARSVNTLNETFSTALQTYANVRTFPADKLQEEKTRSMGAYSVCLFNVAMMLDCKERVERVKQFCVTEERIWTLLQPQDPDFAKAESEAKRFLADQEHLLAGTQGWLNPYATKSMQHFTGSLTAKTLQFCQLTNSTLKGAGSPATTTLSTELSLIGDDAQEAQNYFRKWTEIYDLVFQKMQTIYQKENLHILNVMGLFAQLKGEISALDHALQKQQGNPPSAQELDRAVASIKDLIRYFVTEFAKMGELMQMLGQGGRFLAVCEPPSDIVSFQAHFPKLMNERTKVETASLNRSTTILEYTRLVGIQYRAALDSMQGVGYEDSGFYRGLNRLEALTNKGGAPLTPVEKTVQFIRGWIGPVAGVFPAYANPRWRPELEVKKEEPKKDEPVPVTPLESVVTA